MDFRNALHHWHGDPSLPVNWRSDVKTAYFSGLWTRNRTSFVHSRKSSVLKGFYLSTYFLALLKLTNTICYCSGNHFPVTSIEWNHHGTLLATASINDTDVLMWDVDNNRNTPLKRIGFPCALLKWSPGSQRLCSTTVGNVFRVWETNKWTPERWTVPTGSIQSAAWSPCSSYLLFVTTDASTLFSLQFVEEQLYAGNYYSFCRKRLPPLNLIS